MKFTKTLLSLIASAILPLLLLNSCSSYLSKGPVAFTLKIIETSDVHGMLLPHDFKSNKPAAISLAQVYTLVKKERAKDNQEVLLVDNGDILQGQPIVYYYNFEKTDEPHVCAQVMNFMGYEAGAVGNHDIEGGHAVYDKITQEFNFPFLAANAVDEKTGKPYFKPYAIINKKGVRIAVLGLITPQIPSWLPKKIWRGIVFEDMVVSAKKWIPYIQKNERPHLIVGLFHAGTDASYGGQDPKKPFNENGSQLVAEQVPGLDMVFVGHDHRQQNYWVKNQQTGQQVLILGPNDDAKAVAQASIDLIYNRANDTLDKKEIHGEIVGIETFSADQQLLSKFEQHKQEVIAYLQRPVGSFSQTISTRQSIFGDSEFVDLIHQVQLDLTGADISFAAPLSLDTEIKEGPIFVRDMFKLYKYENLLYTMKLSGQEIKDFLEYSYSKWFEQMKSEKDHLLKFAYDGNGKLIWSERNNSYELATRYYNYDSAAGIIYTVDLRKAARKKIKILSLANGQKFNLQKKYLVAVNSYRGNGGGGHLTEGAGLSADQLAARISNSTEKDLRFYLMKWIEKKKVVQPKKFNNWKLLPETWAEQGKKKDFPLIYK